MLHKHLASLFDLCMNRVQMSLFVIDKCNNTAVTVTARTPRPALQHVSALEKGGVTKAAWNAIDHEVSSSMQRQASTDLS